MTADFRSLPIRILSFACSKSAMLTALAPSIAALIAAMLIKFARSAPENPGKYEEVSYKLQFPPTSKIPLFHVSQSIKTIGCFIEPKLPPKLETHPTEVQPGKILDSREVMKSGLAVENATWENQYVLQQQFPTFCLKNKAKLPEEEGARFLAAEKRSLTLRAPTPTYISSNSLPLQEKNGTPASPAIALANIVFPVPGGPTSKTPFGSLPPRRVKRCHKGNKSYNNKDNKEKCRTRPHLRHVLDELDCQGS
ncbi:hypothetical protein CR513_31878, partial [Mucuna pruriens]